MAQKYSGHFIPQQHLRAAHALHSDQSVEKSNECLLFISKFKYFVFLYTFSLSQRLELPHILGRKLCKISRRHNLVCDRRVHLDLPEVSVSALLVVLDHSYLEEEGSDQSLVQILQNK